MAETAASATDPYAPTSQPLRVPPRDRSPSTIPAGRLRGDAQSAWPIGTHPRQLEMAAAQQRANDAADRERGQKYALPAFDAPVPGSRLWATVPQSSLGGKSPQEVHNDWTRAYAGALSDESRRELGKSWGREISPAELQATPSIAAATYQYGEDPGVQTRARQRADLAVPSAPALRKQVGPNSPYSVG